MLCLFLNLGGAGQGPLRGDISPFKVSSRLSRNQKTSRKKCIDLLLFFCLKGLSDDIRYTVCDIRVTATEEKCPEAYFDLL